MRDMIIFDGVCPLCIRSVQFVLQHEASPHYVFAAVQSVAGSGLMRQHGQDPNDTKTFIVIEQGTVYVRSDAALCVARRLRWPWRMLVCIQCVPRLWRDWAYDLVARNRYRWFPQTSQCWLPSALNSKRFLD